MKNNIELVLVMLVFLIACKQKESKPIQQVDLVKKDTITTTPKPNKQTYEHHLLLYNEKYVLKIMPKIHPKDATFESKIHLQKSKTSETIFDKTISLETLLSLTKKNSVYPKDVTLDTIRANYVLDKIIFFNFRADRLYFEARLQPKKEGYRLKVMFNLQYLYEKDFGKLVVNNINVRNWRETKEYEERFNKTAIESSKNCGIIDEFINEEEAVLKRKNLIRIVRSNLLSVSNNKWRYEIKNDSLHIAEKLKFQEKIEYNVYRVPIYKLWRVSKEEDVLTLYTKGKELLSNRFGYRALFTSQAKIKSNASNPKTVELFNNLKELSQLNCFLKSIE